MLSTNNIGNTVVISVNFWHFGTITIVRSLEKLPCNFNEPDVKDIK